MIMDGFRSVEIRVSRFSSAGHVIARHGATGKTGSGSASA
jgi:hypothetical protein